MITCKKDPSTVLPVDKRDKYIGLYKGTVYLSNGCNKIDTIPEYDSVLNAVMIVSKYGELGFSCRSSFHNFDFENIEEDRDSLLYLSIVTGDRCVVSNFCVITKSSLYFHLYDKSDYCYGTNCPQKAKEKSFNGMKIY